MPETTCLNLTLFGIESNNVLSVSSYKSLGIAEIRSDSFPA